MKRIISLGFLGIMSVTAMSQSDSTDVSGQSNSSHTSINNIENAVKQKKYEQDTRITDLQINAESGSLSRYSVQFFGGYNGASVTDLTATSQPNPLNRPVETRTDITGSIGARYRITSDDSIYMSGGMKAYFTHRGYDANPTDLSNPSVEYDHTYMLGAFQARSGIKLQDSTESYYVSEGETTGAELSQTLKYYLPNTGWIFGGTFTAAEYFFSRGFIGKAPGLKNYDSDKISDTNFYLIPSVEYRLLRNLNFNTSYAQGLVHYRKVAAATTFASDPASWRVGVGWGITRDIYVNPYFGFFPTAMSLPNTWIAVNTIVSIF